MRPGGGAISVSSSSSTVRAIEEELSECERPEERVEEQVDVDEELGILLPRLLPSPPAPRKGGMGAS